jgi:hypothetical protein
MYAGSGSFVSDCAWCHVGISDAAPNAPTFSSEARVSHGICGRCLATQLRALAAAPSTVNRVFEPPAPIAAVASLRSGRTRCHPRSRVAM